LICLLTETDLFLSFALAKELCFCGFQGRSAGCSSTITIEQVLHLMNKMNIPAPFRMALPTPPLPPPVPAAAAPPPPPPPTTTATKPNLNDLSSDESEMESSEEDAESVRSRKRMRREVIVGPAVDKGVAHEDVGLKPVSLVPKEVPVIRKKNLVLQVLILIKVTPKPTTKETTDYSDSTKEPDSANQLLEQKLFVSPQEIERSLFESTEAARAGLNIKLMQIYNILIENYSTMVQNLVNGYMFKGKPIIIQFGRNPAAGKGN
ncbi:hypothetical protein BHE74_00038629, partial [Ensete ventricosum]